MADIKLRLDRAGIGAVLANGAVTGMVDGAAAKVGGNVNETAHDGPVPVDVGSFRAVVGGTAPRAAAYVTMTHPGAIGIEAKRGSLVRAASAAGLPVKAR